MVPPERQRVLTRQAGEDGHLYSARTQSNDNAEHEPHSRASSAAGTNDNYDNHDACADACARAHDDDHNDDGAST